MQDSFHKLSCGLVNGALSNNDIALIFHIDDNFFLTIPESSELCKPSELCLVNGINSLAIPLIAQRSHNASDRLPVKL